MSGPDHERVEVQDAAQAPARAPRADGPLLDLGTKIALVVFALAVLGAIAAIAVAVIAF